MIRGDALLKALGVGQVGPGLDIMRSFYLPYLADWKCSLDYDRRLSDIEWQHVGWGAFSDKILSWLATPRSHLDISNTYIVDGEEDNLVISSIKERYASRDMPSLVSLVRSTFPLQATKMGDKLDLLILARKYKKDFREERRKIIA